MFLFNHMDIRALWFTDFNLSPIKEKLLTKDSPHNEDRHFQAIWERKRISLLPRRMETLNAWDFTKA